MRKIFIIPLLCLLYISIFAVSTPVQAAESPTSIITTITGPPVILTETSDRISVNFTMFVIDFFKSGYETVYLPNGTILVYIHNMVLQYYDDKVKDWRQAGVFDSVTWTKIDDYHYQVTKFYKDASTNPVTNYTITYDIRSDSPVKITIRIENGATRQYRLQWSLDGIIYQNWQELKNVDNVKYQLLFGDESVDYGFIKINWQDIYEEFKADTVSYSISTSAQGRKADIYFNLGTVEAGSVLTIDPSLIGTSEIYTATTYNAQRKIVRTSNGTLYVVYRKQLSGYYQIYVAKSTDNGATWTDETRISTYTGMESYDQYDPSIAVDSNNYLHVVWHGCATGYTSYYQIWYVKYTTSWSTPVRISTYTSMESYHQYYPSIAVDSNNYLHVVWYGSATGYSPYAQIWYVKYTTSWSTPVRISTYTGMESNNQLYPSIAVDSNNYLHVVWYGYATGYTSYTQIWYAEYTTSWSTPVRISTYAGMESYSQTYPSIAVDFNNYLHVVWHGRASGYTSFYQIWYTKYTTSWSTPVRISTYAGMDIYNQYDPSIAVDSNNYLHVVWHGSATGYTDYNKVWYAKYTTSWQTPIVLQATGQNQYPNLRWSRYPTSNQVTNRIDYVFTAGASSPYNVTYDYLTINLPNAPTLNSPSANYRFNPSASVTFTWTFSDNDTGDSQSAYQLQIGNSDFSIIYLDTGKVMSTSTSTNRTLPSNMTIGLYYWRVKTWDSTDGEGAWSSGRAIIVDRIKVNSLMADDTRRDIGTTATLSVQLIYEYDNAYITSGTFTLNGLTLSYSGSNGVWTATQSKSTVTAVTYNSVAGTEGTYGLTTVNMNSQSVTVIWDRLKIIAMSADDTRRDVGSTVTVSVTIKYEYDNMIVTTGSLTLNGLTLIYSGSNGVWTATDSKSTVTSVTYDSVSGSDGTYGLTAVNMNNKKVTVIWDRLELYYVGFNSSRVNVGATVEVRFKIRYQYDGVAFDNTKGTVNIEGGAATWDSTNGWWKRSIVQSSSVGSNLYDIDDLTFTDTQYGLTAKVGTANGTVITDRIEVVDYGTSDNRADVGSNVLYWWKLRYDYDDVVFDNSKGSVTIGGMSATWNSTNSRWEVSVTLPSTPQLTTKNLDFIDNTYGLTAITGTTSQSVIADRIEVYNAWVSSSRADLNSTQYVYFQLRYDYDDSIFDNSKGSVTINGVSATWDSANSRWYISTSKSTVGNYSYFLAFTDNTYGLTAVTGTTSLNIIFDQLQLYDYGVSDSRASVGDTVTIWIKLQYAFDSVVFDSSKGTVNIGGTSATWDSANSRWYINQTQSSVQKVDYLCPSSFTDNAYGLTIISGSVMQSIIWDRVNINSFTVTDDRINVGSTATFGVGGVYEYDLTPWSGTYTLNDTSIKDEVGKYGYTIISITDYNYGITVFEKSVPDVCVIFDKPIVFPAFSADGSPNFSLKSAYDGSTLTYSLTYDTEKISFSGISYGLKDFTWNALTRYYNDKPFKITTDTNSTITVTTVDPSTRKIIFSVVGPANVSIWVGSIDKPYQVKVDGAVVNFVWDDATKTLTIPITSTTVELNFPAPVEEEGRGGGGIIWIPTVPTPTESTTPSVSPTPPSFEASSETVKFGLFVIVLAGVAALVAKEVQERSKISYKFKTAFKPAKVTKKEFKTAFKPAKVTKKDWDKARKKKWWG